MSDDFDEHNEALAAEEEWRREDDLRNEMAIAHHLEDLERDDDAR